VSFGFLVVSLVRVPLLQLPQLTAIFAVAYAIGLVVPLTPGGLGVREGVMVLLLSPLMRPPWPAMVAAAARMWTTVGELAFFPMALRARPRVRDREANAHPEMPRDTIPVTTTGGPPC
jgi:hypothetical protein